MNVPECQSHVMVMSLKTILRLKGHINICKSYLTIPTANSKQFFAPKTIPVRIYSDCPNMSKRGLAFLAPGYEELEFISAVDIMRRAGMEVCIVGLPDQNPVKSARNVAIVPDIGLNDAGEAGPFDVMVLPGGLGCSKALIESQQVGKMLKDQEGSGRKVAAICAAPTVLKAHCIGVGKKVTSYPAMAATMKEGGTYDYQEEDVVVDGNIITSRGPGTATVFGLTIVKELLGLEKACEVAKAMLIKF